MRSKLEDLGLCKLLARLHVGTDTTLATGRLQLTTLDRVVRRRDHRGGLRQRRRELRAAVPTSFHAETQQHVHRNFTSHTQQLT